MRAGVEKRGGVKREGAKQVYVRKNGKQDEERRQEALI